MSRIIPMARLCSFHILLRLFRKLFWREAANKPNKSSSCTTCFLCVHFFLIYTHTHKQELWNRKRPRSELLECALTDTFTKSTNIFAFIHTSPHPHTHTHTHTHKHTCTQTQTHTHTQNETWSMMKISFLNKAMINPRLNWPSTCICSKSVFLISRRSSDSAFLLGLK